jgi:hypothetical protein
MAALVVTVLEAVIIQVAVPAAVPVATVVMAVVQIMLEILVQTEEVQEVILEPEAVEVLAEEMIYSTTQVPEKVLAAEV